MDFTNYQDRKQRLYAGLQQLASIAKNHDMTQAAEALVQEAGGLAQERFHVAVVGMFSRGKSTFVDALLGKRILPTSKNPTTAIISQVTYQDQPEFILYFKDESKPEQHLTEDEFIQLTVPKMADQTDKAQVEAMLHAQDRLESISFAEVKYPLGFCRDGVDLVDTPGMNDTDESRVEITYRYLNQSDAVIMLLAANQILTKSEIEFLQERILNNQIRDVFFIINKKDTLAGAEEEQKVIDFAVQHLKEILPADVPADKNIYLVSSYQALLYRRQASGEELKLKQRMKLPKTFSDTGFEQLEDALNDYLVHDKGERKLQVYLRKAGKHAEDMLATLQSVHEEYEHSMDEILQKIEEMTPKFQRARTEVKAIADDMKTNLSRYRSNVVDQCNLACDNMLGAALQAVDDYEGKIETNRIKAGINNAISREQRKFMNDAMEYQDTIFTAEIGKSQKRLRAIWQDIDMGDPTGDNLPVPMSNYSMNFNVSTGFQMTKEKSDIASYAIGGAIGVALAGAVLPALALGAVAAWCFGVFDDHEEEAKQKIKRSIASQYDDISAKMKRDILRVYEDHCRETAQTLVQLTEQRIGEMERQLNRVLEDKKSKEEEQQAKLASLETSMQDIRGIQGELQKIGVGA